MSRDEAGHTHSILWSLGRASSKSRWKSLRTLNSPNSFSESFTPAQSQQVSAFQPCASPPISTRVFYPLAPRTGAAQRSIDHWLCCLPVFTGGDPAADRKSPGSELPCLWGLPCAGLSHRGLDAALGPGALARRRNMAGSRRPGFQAWLSGCLGGVLNPARAVFPSVKWG